MITSQKRANKLLLMHLAKDADDVANREEKYALQAKNERKFAGKDELIAQHKKQPARIDDDKFEYSICMAFYGYRMSVSRHFRGVARKFRKQVSEV